MKILELVSSHDRSIITEDWLYQKMVLEDFLRYHTLHLLHVFVRSQNSVSIFGIPTKLAEEKIGHYFPYHENKGISSEVIKFSDFEENSFTSRLSDFIKNDVKSYELTNNSQDSVITITFGRDRDMGHETIIYYSPTKKRYFWYDSSFHYDGLFSTNDQNIFLKGVSERLLAFKTDMFYKFSNFYLTAYNLS